MRWAVIGLVAMLTPASALADAPTSSLGIDAVIKLDLKGQVPGRCGFVAAPPASVDLGDLEQKGQVTLPFRLDCNSAFDVLVASAEGGLRVHNPGPSGPVPSQFVDHLDYDLAVKVATDQGAVSGHCAASTLTTAGGCDMASAGAGRRLSSGGGVCLNGQGSMVLTWAPPAARLIAGRYQDTITITVEART